MSIILSMLEKDESGPAADTGTAVHYAVAAWHGPADKDARLAGAAMRAAISKFPLADLDSAEQQFRWYTEDPRNQKAEVVLCEAKIEVRLKASKLDPTQEDIVIHGTVDQVRKEKYQYVAWDIKTGSPEGLDMLNAHCLQLVAYQLGASAKLKQVVRGAGIIRTKDYLKTDRKRNPKPGPVFYEAPWSHSDAAILLSVVAQRVADIRRGYYHPSPSEDACKWCVGVGNCTQVIRESNEQAN